jgi:FtsH-binding integral membrane protein
MSLLACLVSALAPVCVYLSSAEQRITQAPLHRVWRAIGFMLSGAGVLLWSTSVSTPAAFFASGSMWATAYVVLPYISWVKLPAVADE